MKRTIRVREPGANGTCALCGLKKRAPRHRDSSMQSYHLLESPDDEAQPTDGPTKPEAGGSLMNNKTKPPIEFTVTWTQTVRVVVEKYTSPLDAKRIAKNVADCLFDREEDVVAERREDVPMDVHSGGEGTVTSYDECLSAKATKPGTGGAR